MRYIALNLDKCKFWGDPITGIELNWNNPGPIEYKDSIIVQRGIRSGNLLLMDNKSELEFQKVKVPEQDNKKDEFYRRIHEILELNVKLALIEIDKYTTKSNAVIIYTEMLREEESNKKRKTIINHLNDLLKNYNGISLVEEEDVIIEGDPTNPDTIEIKEVNKNSKK